MSFMFRSPASPHSSYKPPKVKGFNAQIAIYPGGTQRFGIGAAGQYIGLQMLHPSLDCSCEGCLLDHGAAGNVCHGVPARLPAAGEAHQRAAVDVRDGRLRRSNAQKDHLIQ